VPVSLPSRQTFARLREGPVQRVALRESALDTTRTNATNIARRFGDDKRAGRFSRLPSAQSIRKP